MTQVKQASVLRQKMGRAAAWLGRPGRAIGLLLLLAALLGLILVDQSSMGVDENIEIYTLDVNIRAYVELFAGPDSPQAQALSEERIQEWHDRDYGQARFYPIWPLMQHFRQAGQARAMLNVLHYYIHLLFLLGVFGLYGIVHRLTRSRGAGLLAAGLLLVNPRFYAESFYNSKDITLLALCLVVLWLGLRFIQQQDWASAVWFGAAAAVTTNGRIIGLAVFGLCGIVYLVDRFVHQSWSARCFWRGFVAVAVLVGVYFLLTPACWQDFFGYWKELIVGTADFDPKRWNGWVLYRDAVYNPTKNPIPWHYIPWFMAITTPLLILALAGLWPVLCILRNRADVQKWLATENLFCLMLGVLFAAPVGYTMLARPNLYNGWRHLYFSYGPVVVLAAVSAYWLWKSRSKWVKRVVTAALAAHFVYFAVFIGVNHPQEYGYFNVLAGPHPEERYDADYWTVGLQEVMLRLHKIDPAFRAAPMSPYCPMWTWDRIVAIRSPQLDEAEYSPFERLWRARYVLDNTSYRRLGQLHANWEILDPTLVEWQAIMDRTVQEQEPLFEVKCGRTVLWRVYENPVWAGLAARRKTQ